MTDQQKADLLARWAQAGAKFGDCGKMCSECAFKQGGIANSEPHNVEAALQCLAGMGSFNCHTDSGNGLQDAGKPCVGFLYANQYWTSREKKDA